jgi:hypothetical protein
MLGIAIRSLELHGQPPRSAFLYATESLLFDANHRGKNGANDFLNAKTLARCRTRVL